MRRRALLLGLTGPLALPGAAVARCEGVVPGARVQNADRDFVGQDLDTLLEQGWIEFAAYECVSA